MDYTSFKASIDISITRSASEISTYDRKNGPMRVSSFFMRRRAQPINEGGCCTKSTSKIKSCCQFFLLHLYNNHKVALVIGFLAVTIGVLGLVVSFGMSSLLSACLITGGSVLILGTLYHSASTALNCGLCRNEHVIAVNDDSDVEE